MKKDLESHLSKRESSFLRHLKAKYRRRHGIKESYDGVVKSRRVEKGKKDLSCEKVRKSQDQVKGSPTLTCSKARLIFSPKCRLFDIMSHQKRTLFVLSIEKRENKRRSGPKGKVFLWLVSWCRGGGSFLLKENLFKNKRRRQGNEEWLRFHAIC